MARIYMLSLLSTNRVVMAATVDATPDRTKMGDRKPNPRLAEAHTHGMEAQSETSLSTVIATDANTARRVLPDSPTDQRRGGDLYKNAYVYGPTLDFEWRCNPPRQPGQRRQHNTYNQQLMQKRGAYQGRVSELPCQLFVARQQEMMGNPQDGQVASRVEGL